MKTLVLLVVAVLIPICPGVLPVSAQQVAVDRDQLIRSDVKRAFDQYLAWFAAGRSDLIAERAYDVPTLLLFADGLDVLASREMVNARFETILKRLIADGYVKSEMPSPTICVLSESAAILSGRYVRYRKDGSVMGEYGGTYIFTKTAAGWRMVSQIVHDPSKVLSCST